MFCALQLLWGIPPWASAVLDVCLCTGSAQLAYTTRPCPLPNGQRDRRHGYRLQGLLNRRRLQDHVLRPSCAIASALPGVIESP